MILITFFIMAFLALCLCVAGAWPAPKSPQRKGHFVTRWEWDDEFDPKEPK